MPFTIWRNGELLGSILVAFAGDQTKGVGGILQPTAAFGDIAPMTQATLTFSTTRVIIQEYHSNTDKGSVELRKLTPEDHVPPQRVLELHDDAGDRINTSMITIERMDIPADGEFAHACQIFGFYGSAWSVLAAFHLDSSAES